MLLSEFAANQTVRVEVFSCGLGTKPEGPSVPVVNRKRIMSKISIITAASVCLLAITYVQASVVVVSPSDMNGWSFLTTDNNGDPAPGNGNTAQMVTGPATPPLGTGSAQLATAPGQGDTSAQILTTLYNGIALSSLTSLSYSTYDTVNNGQQFPYLKISLNNGDALFFEPPYQTPSSGNPSLPNQGATVINQWQTWNAFAGGWWNNNGDFNPGTTEGSTLGVDSLSAYLALSGNSGVTIAGISLRVGYASADDNFNGYVDNVTIGTTMGMTTYDFESAAPVPEATTMIAGALLLLPFGVSTFRSLRRNCIG